MKKSPCRDCPHRTVHCHSRCTAYLRFRTAQEELRELRTELFLQEDSWFAYRSRVSRRVQQRLNGRA